MRMAVQGDVMVAEFFNHHSVFRLYLHRDKITGVIVGAGAYGYYGAVLLSLSGFVGQNYASVCCVICRIELNEYSVVEEFLDLHVHVLSLGT